MTGDNVYTTEEDYQEQMGIPRCPDCGGMLVGESPDATHYFSCSDCGSSFYLTDGGVLIIDPPKGSGHTCENCGESLSGGTYVAAWEEGNAGPYTICPHCGYRNYEYDYDD